MAKAGRKVIPPASSIFVCLIIHRCFKKKHDSKFRILLYVR